MYQALYRKYRPRSFSEVTGQQHITQTLRSQIETGRFSHAYLFVGTRGTGKTTCAKILSRAVNCQEPVGGDPCNKCPSCLGIENGSIFDVLELDAASNNSVDDIRDIRDDAVYTPASVKKRVFILDEVHMLSPSASNALLKILEEPPEHIIFILATTDMHKVSATIQSRCQKFLFRRLSIDEISSRLSSIAQSENLTLTQDAASTLARLADGSMRDGVSLLDQCVSGKEINLETVQNLLGLASQDELARLVRMIAANDIVSSLDVLDNLYKDGKDMAALTSGLLGIMRDMLIAKLDPSSTLMSSGLPNSELSEMSKLYSDERLICCLEIMKDALAGLTRAGASKLALEMCIVHMCRDVGAIAPVVREHPQADTRSTPTTMPVEVSKPDVGTVAPDCPRADTRSTPTVEPEQMATPEPSRTTGAVVPTATPVSSHDEPLVQLLGHIHDRPLRALLDSSSKARATFTDGKLTIYMKDEFNASVLKNSFTEALREAASKAFGREVMLIIETEKEKTDDSTQKKFEDLMSFGDIVKVE